MRTKHCSTTPYQAEGAGESSAQVSVAITTAAFVVTGQGLDP
jgi:hypothetical protein